MQQMWGKEFLFYFLEWSLHTNSRVRSFENTFYRTVDTTLPSKHILMFILSILSTGKDSGVTSDLSSQRPALLTLQRDNLSHQHLRVHLLGEHLHGRVHQLGAEDGQELLPHGLPLAPFGWTGPLSIPGRTALGSLRRGRMRMGRMRMRRGPKWSGPVHMLLLLVVVAVLELWRLAECMPADGVRAVRGEMRRSVGEVGLPLLVVVSRWGGVRAAAARHSWRRAELVSEAMQVLVVAPAVYGAQTRIQLLLRLAVQRGQAVVRRLPAAPLRPVGRPLAGALTRPHPVLLLVFLGLCGTTATVRP